MNACPCCGWPTGTRSWARNGTAACLGPEEQAVRYADPAVLSPQDLTRRRDRYDGGQSDD